MRQADDDYPNDTPNPNNPRSENNLTTRPTHVSINNKRSSRFASGANAQRIAASGVANLMQ